MAVRFSLALILALGLFACDHGTIHILRSPNGKIREMWVEKGLSGRPTVRDGLFQSFHRDGTRESAIEYHDGKKNGTARFWSLGGQLSFQGKYRNNFLLAEKRFDELGRTLLNRKYKQASTKIKAIGPDGDSLAVEETCAWTDEKSGRLKHGLCELKYPDNHLLSTRYFHLGQLQGPVKAWYPDGKPWMEGGYNQNTPVGSWRTWSQNGKPLWSCTYAMGAKEGIAREWFPDGKPKSTAQFKQGKQNGPYEEWYPNGKIRLKGEYQQGQREGQELAWYPDGVKLYSGNYLTGKLDGDFYQWYPGGRLRLHCRFKEGRKAGRSRVWYRNGALLEQAIFQDGLLNGPYRTWGPEGTPLASKVFQAGAVAFDSKAKELLELLGADQIRVPVGMLGFYWGMAVNDCRANLSLLQATQIRSSENELSGHLFAFSDRHPTESRVKLEFNSQGELWSIHLDLKQTNSADFFPICENLETEIGSELGTAGIRTGEGSGQYYLTRKKAWGKFTITTGTGVDSNKVITQELPVVRAEGFSPGNSGWFRFSLANHLYLEYANPANAAITPPRWPEETFLAGR